LRHPYGKPIGRPRLASETEANIRAALQRGDKGMRKIAVQFGVATGSVLRVVGHVHRRLIVARIAKDPIMMDHGPGPPRLQGRFGRARSDEAQR
jgi:hypothetical protein